jgi:uncharacterized LabA/DUF88 family protein
VGAASLGNDRDSPTPAGRGAGRRTEPLSLRSQPLLAEHRLLQDEERFFDALVDIGFETKIKDIKTFGDGSKKADWDVGMSLDAVTLASHVDTVVLCTGDGDFSRLCSHLRHEGVRVEVMAFKESTADELVEATDAFLDLSERQDTFLL